MSGLPRKNLGATPTVFQCTIDDDGADSRGENNELLTKRSQEHSNNEQMHAEILQTATVKGKTSKREILISWWPECIWCIFTIGLLISLVALLKTYDGQPAPQWPKAISINTIVAAIATVCRASMVIPISEGLSQLKWNAFARAQRPLVDLQTFDQASRGPLGSLKLLSQTRGRLLGVSTIAALILVSGLATSSLTQASIVFAPPSQKLTQDATMRKSTILTLDDWYLLDDHLTSAAFQTFFISERQRANVALEPRCPSSECHWDKFRSLDICSVERNVTDKLLLDLQDPDDLDNFDLVQAPDSRIPEDRLEYWRVTLGDDPETSFQVDDVNFYNWVSATTVRNAEQTRALWGDDSDALPKTILSTQAFIYKKLPYPGKQVATSYRGSNSPYRAVTVTWYWCVKEYEASVTRGDAHVKAVETSYNVTRTVNEIEYGEEVYYHMTDTLTSEVFTAPSKSWSLGTQAKIEPMGRANDGLSSMAMSRIIGNVTTTEEDPWDNIMTWSEYTTLAMSASLRSYGTDESAVVQGFAEIGPLTVIVRWEWLSLLVLQVALMIAFVVYVILETAKLSIKVVKGSNIAELTAIMGFNQDSKTESKVLLVGGMAARVEGELVGRLVENNGDWNLEVDRRATAQS